MSLQNPKLLLQRINPSHQIYYKFLVRRFDLLKLILNTVIQNTTKNSPHVADLSKVQSTCEKLAKRMSHEFLDQAIDDSTPTEYLGKLSGAVTQLERTIAMVTPVEVSLIEELSRIALLWGREIAHDLLTQSGITRGYDFKSVYPLVIDALFGGTIGHSSVLLKRITDSTIEYDLRDHAYLRLAGLPAPKQDIFSKIDELVIRGFITAIIPSIGYERLRKPLSDGVFCQDVFYNR